MLGKKVLVHSKKNAWPNGNAFVDVYAVLFRSLGADVVLDEKVPRGAADLVQWIGAGKKSRFRVSTHSLT